MKKNLLNKLFYYLLFLMPIIDFITSIYTWNGKHFWVSSVLKTLILGVFFLIVLKKNKDRKICLILLLYFIIDGIYIIASNSNIVMYVTSLLKIFFLPIALLFLKDYDNKIINTNFLVKIFYLYLLLLIVPYFLGIGHNINEIYVNKEAYLSFFYSGNELSGVLLCLMPLVLNYLKEHHNWLVKIVGLFLIIFGIYLLKTKTLVIGFVFSVLYILWKNRKRTIKYLMYIPIVLIVFVGLVLVLVKNFDVALKYYEIDSASEVFSIKFIDRVMLSSRLSFAGDAFLELKNKDVSKYIFGVGDVSSELVKNSEIDLIDIFFSIGLLGLAVYILVMVYVLRKIKLKNIYAFSFYLTLIASVFAGHILNSAMVSIFLPLIVMANKNDDRRRKVLVVSNMYPSRWARHYGSFVKNMVDCLESDFIVRKSVMSKHKNIFSKLISYSIFYLKTFIKSFGSYDYIWVHFISHSTKPVLFSYRFTKNTQLILNGHGNDLVADYNFEEKNIKRSKKYLKYASLVVVSSNYFKKEVNRIYNYPLDKIKIYHAGGVDLAKFEKLDKYECKKKLGLDENISYIGLVSRLEKNKGYDTLLESMYLLKDDEEFRNTKLLVIGSGIEAKNFDYLVSKYHLENVVIKKDFVYQNDLVNYYNAFDVLVFPTKRKSESLGLVGLEAMACHTFVIGCDRYGPSEYLKNGENALTYHSDSAKSLARKIKMYYNMSEKRCESYLLNGYETVKRFSREATKKELKEIIGEI